MDRTRVLQGVRQMRFETLLARQESGELSQAEAGEMLGVTERTFRRWRDRLRDERVEGLVDRRLGRVSGRRAALAEVERMLGLYVEQYSDFTVKHFHEQMVKRHGYKLGYTVTRLGSVRIRANSILAFGRPEISCRCQNVQCDTA